MSVSNVVKIDYDKTKLALTVIYGGGSVWVYSPVSMEMYCLLLESHRDLSKEVHKLVRNTNIVGVNK